VSGSLSGVLIHLVSVCLLLGNGIDNGDPIQSEMLFVMVFQFASLPISVDNLTRHEILNLVHLALCHNFIN